jgi:hypothetical protein
LISGECSEGVYKRFVVDELPESLCTPPSERVLRLQRPAQSNNIGGAVAALESAPTRVFGPIFLEFLGFKFTGRHRRLLRF